MGHVLFRFKNFIFPILLFGCLAVPTIGFTKTYYIYVDTKPSSGANIFINNTLKGQSSPDSKIPVWGGSWDIRLELPGYKTFEGRINVSKTNERFSYKLEPAPALLDVIVPVTDQTAQGAELFIDGKSKGFVPVEGIEVSPGNHLVEAKSKPGSVTPGIFSQNIEFKPGERKSITMKLTSTVVSSPIEDKKPQEKKVVSYLTIVVPATEPSCSGADTYVGGKLLGQAPFDRVEVEPGTRLVEIKKRGYEPIKSRQTFLAGQETDIDCVLRLEKKDETVGLQEKKGSLALTVMMNGQRLTNGIVVIDGQKTFAIDGVIADLSAGNHTIEVKVDGYQPDIRNIIIKASDEPTAMAIELRQVVVKTTGSVRVVLPTPIPGAQYYVNGNEVDASQIISPVGVEVPSGKVIIVMRKPAWGEVTKEIPNMVSGKTEVVEIKSGRLTFQLNTEPGELSIDGVQAGMTNQVFDVAPGSHRVEIRKRGYLPYVQSIEVKADQPSMIEVGLASAPMDPEMARFTASTFGASTLQPGTFAVGLGTGYPHFGSLRFDAGIFKWKFIGLDAGVELRTSVYETDVGANVRFQAFGSRFFAIGLNMFIGGGGGPRSRNSFTFELGAPVTVIAGRWAKLTFTPYIQAYSDRLCPAEDTIQKLQTPDALAIGDPAEWFTGDRCVRGENGQNPIYAVAGLGFDNNGMVVSMAPSYRDANGQVRSEFKVDGTPVLDRFGGYRGMLRGAIEINPSSHWTITGIVEGSPNQKERQQYTSKFNGIFPSIDLPIYGRLLFTYKFN